MKFLVATSLALWGAMLVSGCSSGDGTPATTSFNPFGTEPSGSTSEPTTGSNNPPVSATGEGGAGGTEGTGGAGGSGGPETLAQACAAACAQFDAFCPSYQSPTCPSDCSQTATSYSGCETQYEAVLSCVASATDFTCDGGMLETAGCGSSQDALVACLSGTATTTTAGGAAL